MQRRRACTRIRASPSRTATRSGRRSTRSAKRSTASSRTHDVRLTQGGEPTFVSIDDMEGAEWNYTAHVAAASASWPRRCCAGLRSASRPAACSTTGRASGIRASRCRAGRSASYWRNDGEPLWRDAAPHRRSRRSPAQRRSTTRSAFDRARSRQRLGCRDDLIITAYEDVPKLFATKPRCRSNADPLQADLSQARASVRDSRACCSAGLATPAGFVLPLRRSGRGRGCACRHRLAVEPVAVASRAAVSPSRAIRRSGLRLPLGFAARRPARGRGASRRSIRSRRRRALPPRGALGRAQGARARRRRRAR